MLPKREYMLKNGAIGSSRFVLFNVFWLSVDKILYVFLTYYFCCGTQETFMVSILIF